MSPSPVELSKDFLVVNSFGLVQSLPVGEAILPGDGRLRYWAWVIAFNSEKAMHLCLEDFYVIRMS